MDSDPICQQVVYHDVESENGSIGRNGFRFEIYLIQNK